MKSLRMVILGVLLLAFVLGALTALSRLRNKNTDAASPGTPEDKAPYKKADLQALTEKLSSPVEEVRRAAEKDLSAAGIFAAEILNEAENKADPRAKDALVRLKNKLRFNALKSIDYLDALPSGTAIAVSFPSLHETVEQAKVTALGRILMRPELAGIRSDFIQQLSRDEAGRPRLLKPEDVGGQFAIGFFGAGGQTFGAALELKGADPQETYAELTERYIRAGGSIYEFENIECVEAAAKIEQGAHSRTGRNLFYGNGRDALHALLRTLLNGPSLGGTKEVAQLRSALGAKPAALAVYNLPQILAELKKNDPQGEQHVRALAEKAGALKPGFAGTSLSVTKDGFEDRAALFLGDAPTGVLRALTVPPQARAPLELFDKMPSNALLALTFYVDGAKLEKALGELMDTLRKANPNDRSLEAGPVETLRKSEALLGLKPGELMSSIKGEVALWITFAPGFPVVLPDVNIGITLESEQRANELLEQSAKAYAKLGGDGFKRMTYNKHPVCIFEPKLNSAPQLGAAASWTVDKNRLYFCSTTAGLQKQINHLDRATAGLLTRPNVTKALGDFTAAERRGAVLYADSPSVLSVLMPLLLMAAQNSTELTEAEKKQLAALPPPGDLVRDFPVLLGFAGTDGKRLDAVLRGPLPLSALYLLAAGSAVRK